MRLDQLTNKYYTSYLRHMETKNYSQTTKNNYIFSLQKFFKYLRTRHTIRITNENISLILDEYQTALKQSGKYSPKTIKKIKISKNWTKL